MPRAEGRRRFGDDKYKDATFFVREHLESAGGKCDHFHDGLGFLNSHAAIGAEVERLKSQIYVLQVDTPEDLWQVVDSRVPTFLVQQTVRLLVIDSLAGLYRGQEHTHAAGAAGVRSVRRVRHDS